MSGFLLNPFMGGMSFTFFASSTATQTDSCLIPSSILKSDVALYLDVENTSTLTVPTNVVPTGFTSIGSYTVSGVTGGRVTCSYKILAGTESGANLTGINPNTTSDKIVLVFRPNTVVNTVTVNSLNGQATTATPTNQSLNMSGATSSPVIGIATYAANGSVSTRGDSGGAMTEVSASSRAYAKYVIYNSGTTPADSTISMSDGGLNCMTSFYLTFT